MPSIDVIFVGHRRGRGAQRQRHARVDRRCHLRGGRRARRRAVPRRHRDPRPRRRPTGPRVGAPRPRHHPAHHLGLYRLVGPRRRRPPDGPHRHHPLVVLRRARRPRCRPDRRRVVEHLDRRIITAAGVSSGIDMALRARRASGRPHRRAGGPADDRVRPRSHRSTAVRWPRPRRHREPGARVRRPPPVPGSPPPCRRPGPARARSNWTRVERAGRRRRTSSIGEGSGHAKKDDARRRSTGPGSPTPTSTTWARSRSTRS